MADAIVPGRGLGRGPGGGMGRFRDKALCDRVKGIIRKQYPDVSESDDRFWELTTSLYRKMGGTMLKAGTTIMDAKFFVKDGRLMLKAKRAAEIGETRTWSDGKKYKKTIDGWVPAGEDTKGKEPAKEPGEKPDKKEKPKVDSKKRTALKNAVKSLITTLTDVFAGKGGEEEAARGMEQAGQAAVEKGKKKATQKKLSQNGKA